MIGKLFVPISSLMLYIKHQHHDADDGNEFDAQLIRIIAYEATFFISYLCACLYFSKYTDFKVRSNLTLISEIKIQAIMLPMCTRRISMRTFAFVKNLSWCFSSPLILHTFGTVIGVDLKTNIRLELCIHTLHMIVQSFPWNAYLLYTFYALMYALYLGNVYLMFKQKVLCITLLIYSWVGIGVTETLFLMDLVSITTYLMFTSINEIIVKGLFFALIVYKDYVLTLYQHNVTYEDLKVFSSFNRMIPESKNLLLRELKRAIDHILSDKNVIQRSTVSMSEQVYCRHFSDDFIKRILRFNSVHVEEVFILFSDIVEYSVMCRTTSPGDIVQMLDTLYQKYDKALDDFQELQKIESIGDCYFITSLLDKQEGRGGPHQDGTVETLRSIIDFAKTMLKIASDVDVSIRIGVHVGHVSVGIVGTDIPRFAVVGNDVNIAARLESTCVVNSIQISKAVHDLIVIFDEDVPIKSREVVDAKNIGKVVAFILA